MLIAMAGLPASGKSAVARELAAQLHAVLLDKDEVRAKLFKEAVDYKREQDDLCVNIIYDVACYHLAERPAIPVILDGRSYSRRYQVEALKTTASRAQVALAIIECVCSTETARARLASDARIHPAANRDFSLYQRSLAASEAIEEPRLLIDTDRHSVTEGVQLALLHMKSLETCLK